jgi:hypothetical protein
MTEASERMALLGRLLSHGLVGRDAELSRLRAWRAQDGPMVLRGIGGIGKSTLLARFLLERPGAVYVDLARPHCRRGELGAVLEEILRQRGSGEPLVILDSLEEGPRLQLPQLVHELSCRWDGVRLLVSGRGRPAALSSCPELELGELEPGMARVLFDRVLSHRRPPHTLPFGMRSQILDLVGRSPLAMYLAADVLGAKGLPASRAAQLGRVRDRFAREFLLQRILERVPSVEGDLPGLLRAVVRGVFALRRLSPRTLDEVVLPALRLPSSPGGEALYRALLDRVGWLGVEEEGSLVLDEALRRPARLALSYDCPALIETIGLRAVRHFEGRAEPWARDELAYHRLMVGEPPDALGPLLAPEVCASLLRSVSDLPPASALELEQLADGHPLQTAQARQLEREVESSAEVALQAGDTNRAHDVLADVPTPLPTSPLFHLHSRLHEAQGDWPAAVEAEQRNLAAARASADPRRLVGAALRLADLLQQSGDPDAALAVLQQTEADGLLHGHLELRSDLDRALLVSPPPVLQQLQGGR